MQQFYYYLSNPYLLFHFLSCHRNDHWSPLCCVGEETWVHNHLLAMFISALFCSFTVFISKNFTPLKIIIIPWKYKLMWNVIFRLKLESVARTTHISGKANDKDLCHPSTFLIMLWKEYGLCSYVCWDEIQTLWWCIIYT